MSAGAQSGDEAQRKRPDAGGMSGRFGQHALEYREFVRWAEQTFADQADVQIWAGLQHRKAKNEVRAKAAFKRALMAAPGDPLAMHLIGSSQPHSRRI
jgi:hypothetical protein